VTVLASTTRPLGGETGVGTSGRRSRGTVRNAWKRNDSVVFARIRIPFQGTPWRFKSSHPHRQITRNPGTLREQTIDDIDRHNRRNAAKAEARHLGYRLAIEGVGAPNLKHFAAVAYKQPEPSERRFLCGHEGSDDVAGLEAGLEILRDSLKRGAWPDGTPVLVA
jgi:hypothetical protein